MNIDFRALRKAAGLTQVQLAERAGLKQSTISTLERRGSKSIETVERVLAALGLRLAVEGGER